MATDNQIPVSIDYTSRDFYSLRADLINRVGLRVNSNERLSQDGKYAWNPQNPADFGVAMVEAFAHVGDITNYYIDRVANESNLSTAIQRQTLLNIAYMYGYKPSGWKAATVDITVNNPTANSLTLPKGTVLSVTISSQTNVTAAVLTEYFTVVDDVDAIAGEAPEPGVISHGRNVSALPENQAIDSLDIPGELLGSSTGYANQSFKLKYDHVVDDSIEVYVKNGDLFVKWFQVDSLINSGPSDAVYSVTYSSDDKVSINFGNNINGAIPAYGDEIKATYVVGGGVEGNIEGGQTFTIEYVPADTLITVSDLSGLSITSGSTDKGIGGENPEANSSIRKNAPLAFKTSSRAVSLIDFKNLSLSVSGIGKAAAYADSPNSVVVYIGPVISDSSNDYYPGWTTSSQDIVTSSWVTLQSSVQGFLGNKTQIGTTVTILPPNYFDVNIKVEYVKEDAYKDVDIISAITTALVTGFGYNYMDFDTPLRPEKVEQLLSVIPGIDTIKVLKLNSASPDDGTRSVIVPGQGELPVFTATNVSGSIFPAASLSNLAVTISNGTMPTFNTLTKSYTFTSTSSTMTITATSANTLSGFASTLTYTFTDGSGSSSSGSLTSGSASSSLTLATGNNVIDVIVTSADGLTTNTYSITVVK